MNRRQTAVSDRFKYFPLQQEVVASDHLKFSSDNATVDILSADGLALGKSLVQILQTVNLSNQGKLIINVDAPVDLQFLLNYLVAPSENFQNRLATGEIHININSFAAFRHMFSLITATDHEQVLTLPEYNNFKRPVTWDIAVPQASVSEYMNQAKMDLLVMLPEYRSVIEHTFEKIEDYFFSNANVIYVAAKDPTQTLYRRHGVVNTAILNGVAHEGRVMYVQSDETTHLFVSGNEGVSVDAGNVLGEAYRHALHEQNTISQESYFLTHAHLDHVAGLASSIKQDTLDEVAVRVFIAESTLPQFIGFYMARRNELRNLGFGSIFQVMTDKSYVPVGKGIMRLLPAPPNNLRHFIDSRGFVYTEGDLMRVFTGDINLPFPSFTASLEEKAQYKLNMESALDSYFGAIFDEARKANMETLELFVDFGHFSPEWQAFMEKSIMNFTQATGITLAILYKEHLKNKTGTNEELSRDVRPQLKEHSHVLHFRQPA